MGMGGFGPGGSSVMGMMQPSLGMQLSMGGKGAPPMMGMPFDKDGGRGRGPKGNKGRKGGKDAMFGLGGSVGLGGLGGGVGQLPVGGGLEGGIPGGLGVAPREGAASTVEQSELV